MGRKAKNKKGKKVVEEKYRTVIKKFRVTEYEGNKIDTYAKIHTDGNVSAFLRTAALKQLRWPKSLGR